AVVVEARLLVALLAEIAIALQLHFDLRTARLQRRAAERVVLLERHDRALLIDLEDRRAKVVVVLIPDRQRWRSVVALRDMVDDRDAALVVDHVNRVAGQQGSAVLRLRERLEAIEMNALLDQPALAGHDLPDALAVGVVLIPGRAAAAEIQTGHASLEIPEDAREVGQRGQIP